MSQIHLNISSLVGNALSVITIMGIILVAGSMIVLTVGTVIDHNFLFTGLAMIFPLLVVGLICIAIGSKLLEILK